MHIFDNLPEIKDQICLLTGKTKSKKEIYKSIRNNNTKIFNWNSFRLQ